MPTGKEIHGHGVHLSCPTYFTRPHSIYYNTCHLWECQNKSLYCAASIYFNWALKSNFYVECVSWFHFLLSQSRVTMWKESSTEDETHKGSMRAIQAPQHWDNPHGGNAELGMVFHLSSWQDAWSWVWAEAIQRSKRDKSFLRAWSVKREACQPMREPELSDRSQ